MQPRVSSKNIPKLNDPSQEVRGLSDKTWRAAEDLGYSPKPIFTASKVTTSQPAEGNTNAACWGVRS